ncbi:unnamed protein product [Parajaminaea phylloscopi]
MTQSLLSWCLCCIPGSRQRGSADSRQASSSTSESTPLLGGDGGQQRSQTLPQGGISRDSSGRIIDGRYSQADGESSIQQASKDRFDNGRHVAGSSTGGQDRAAAEESPDLPSYTAEDLAAVTGWAKQRFTAPAPTVGQQRRTDPPQPSHQPAKTAPPSDGSVQALLEKLARGIAFDDWKTSVPAGEAEANGAEPQAASTKEPAPSSPPSNTTKDSGGL